MYAFSIIHWLVLLVVSALWIIPLYHMLGRVGWPKALAFLALFPPAGLVLFWCVAFGAWRSPA